MSRVQGHCFADPVTGNMPAADVEVSSRLVSELLEAQRPDLAGLAVAPIGFGWDNFSFLVGDDLVARLPRREAAVPLVENEVRWLPEVASRLTLPVPTPVFVGEPRIRVPVEMDTSPLDTGGSGFPSGGSRDAKWGDRPWGLLAGSS